MFEMHEQLERENQICEFNLLLDKTLMQLYPSKYHIEQSYDVLRFKTDFIRGNGSAEDRLYKLINTFSESQRPAANDVKAYFTLIREYNRIKDEFNWCRTENKNEEKTDFKKIKKNPMISFRNSY